MVNNSHKILFLVTEDWYFCSHRLPLAREARRKGFDVVVATRVTSHGKQIEDEGFKLIPIRMARSGKNPLKELLSLLELVRIYKSERPDIVHLVALKPVVYGGIAARLAGVPRVVAAIAGLGYVFTSRQLKARLLRPVLSTLLRALLNRPNVKVILQNPDDRNLLVAAKVVDQERTVLIRGSGVDLAAFAPTPEYPDPPVVLLASRMLWDKGVEEFVNAAEILRRRGTEARFILVGDPDSGNPASVPEEQLRSWHKAGVVECWGRRSDMPEVLAQAHVVCLPSAYGEGVPKVLLEAAASGRPIVTTDTPGCREVVRQGENGLLVPVRSPVELADALQRLIENPELRQKMGARGREIAVNEFALGKVVSETINLYGELLNL